MGDIHRTIDAVWRIESVKLIAGLARIVRDIGRAEDLAHDALVIALEKWPVTGIPDKPGAWLMATARNRALDQIRRDACLEQKMEEYGRYHGDRLNYEQPDYHDGLYTTVDDDVLSLIFTACHPVLSTESQVALTLKILAGLSTNEIARAYLVAEKTIAQRLVRAKRTLKEARVPIEMPEGNELELRLESVLEVIYLIFNEGYSPTLGEHWTRPVLCEEALRLGRILAGFMPHIPEVHGLVALMEIQASRLRARIGPDGQAVLLLDQNRKQWDQLLIQRGLAALERAKRLSAGMQVNPGSASASRSAVLGPYALQASIAACHARARTAQETDWAKIVAIYDALSQKMPSPVVELNRAVAVSMAYGPESGLEIVDQLVSDSSLSNFHLLPSVRGDLLFKLGRKEEAAAEFKRAASLSRNSREQVLLLDRAASCASD